MSLGPTGWTPIYIPPVPEFTVLSAGGLGADRLPKRRQGLTVGTPPPDGRNQPHLTQGRTPPEAKLRPGPGFALGLIRPEELQNDSREFLALLGVEDVLRMGLARQDAKLLGVGG